MTARPSLADLIEKDRPAIGGLEQSRLVLPGTGERAPLIAEQLALAQRLGQGPAVLGNERSIAPFAIAVQEASKQALARPGLAAQ